MQHLRGAGFQVEAKVVNAEERRAIRSAAGMPDFGACHTAKAGPYLVEGHVPAGAIRRLLKERPAGVVGIVVPGMPVGSPGMEQDGREDSYSVMLVDRDGAMRVYERHGPPAGR